MAWMLAVILPACGEALEVVPERVTIAVGEGAPFRESVSLRSPVFKAWSGIRVRSSCDCLRVDGLTSNEGSDVVEFALSCSGLPAGVHNYSLVFREPDRDSDAGPQNVQVPVRIHVAASTRVRNSLQVLDLIPGQSHVRFSWLLSSPSETLSALVVEDLDSPVESFLREVGRDRVGEDAPYLHRVEFEMVTEREFVEGDYSFMLSHGALRVPVCVRVRMEQGLEVWPKRLLTSGSNRKLSFDVSPGALASPRQSIEVQGLDLVRVQRVGSGWRVDGVLPRGGRGGPRTVTFKSGDASASSTVGLHE